MILEIKNLRKIYENVEPLKGVNAKIFKNDVISIIGPSGTGKTTFLRCINRLEDATSGEVVFNGRNIYDSSYNIVDVRKKIGMIFQSFNLFNNLNIIENLMVAPMHILHKSKTEARDIAIKLLDRFKLGDKETNYPHELSGGQKQRVAIMRAIAMEPDILLFDEPTSALDPLMVGEVADIIKDLKNKDLTMMIVTHEMNFARNVSNRVFYMDEGILYEEGSPADVFDHPKKLKTQNFIFKIDSYEYVFNKKDFDLYLMISGLMKYMAKKNLDIHKVNMINLLIEEITINEIFPNLSSDNDIKMVIRINDNEIFIRYANLVDFNFQIINTDEITLSIIKNNLIERKIDEAENQVSYRFNLK